MIMSSSMEFHETWNAPISLTRAVPWNSVEFHGTWSAPIAIARAVPWNSMELGVRQFLWPEQFHGILLNSMELEVHQFRWHEQFHGIPWNVSCHQICKDWSCMDLGGVWSMYNTRWKWLVMLINLLLHIHISILSQITKNSLQIDYIDLWRFTKVYHWK